MPDQIPQSRDELIEALKILVLYFSQSIPVNQLMLPRTFLNNYTNVELVIQFRDDKLIFMTRPASTDTNII